jgi:hypothetical protein
MPVQVGIRWQALDQAGRVRQFDRGAGEQDDEMDGDEKRVG